MFLLGLQNCFSYLDFFANPFQILLQLEAVVALDFSKCEAEILQPDDWDALKRVLQPKDYIDKWRILLWDRAFLPLFANKASPKFTKGMELRKMDGGSKIINRCLYRYFSKLFLLFLLSLPLEPSLKHLYAQQVHCF